MARSVSYGGKAGIIVKRSKVKLRIHIPSSSAINPSTRITPSPTSLIEWDYVKCRPVYRDETNSGCISNDEEMEKEHLNHHVVSEPQPLGVPDVPQPSSALKAKAGRRKARSYGSKNRSNALIASVKEIDADITLHTATKPQPSVSDGFFADNIQASPFPFDASICDALNSVSKPIPVRLASEENFATPFAGKVSKHHRVQKNKKQTCLDFDDKPHQPTCTTSADRAKAFFDQLDKTQQLVCTQGGTPIAPSRACIRTQRRINIDDCRIDYDHYVNALTGVSTPLPMAQFALHRATFFASSKLCFDGFLDGP